MSTPNKSRPCLPPNRLQNAEYKRNLFRVTVDAGTTKEDLEDFEFWKNVSAQCRNSDLIEVVSAANEFFAQCLVINTTDKGANIHVLHFVPLVKEVAKTAAKTKTIAPYKVEYKGDSNKYCVVRTSDKELIKTGFETKELAQEALAQYELEIGLENNS